MKKELIVKDVNINFFSQKEEDFISLTDIAKYKNVEAPADVVKNWMRTKNTIEFLGFWEKINNPNFKLVEFDQFWKNAGANTFVLSPNKWINSTNAIGLISKSGKNGGTFAHKDIAFEFASWISAEFKLYIIKEFQRLKEEENERLLLGWDAKRTLAKVNYKIHTDAIKEHIVPHLVTPKELTFVYANEADVLNMALFGMTAKQWREENKSKKGNIRDEADVRQLVCLANLESMNAELIRQKLSQSERLKQLNKVAIAQMKSLLENKTVEKLNSSK
ncbi:MAG: KilA-N domain-containing protein [Candidatus Moranbacteria bacterium]|nr:KilA-N domain-containing protein [Candidatus Moranbacteria bacterium]